MSGERTEKATKRKQDKARKEGQFPASKELLASLQFLTFVVLLAIGWSPFLERMRGMARYFLTAAFHIQLTGNSMSTLYRQSVGEAFMPLLWLGGGLTTVALAGQLGSTRLGFAFEKLAPDLKRLSPLQKIKSLPSQNFGSFFQALLFLPLLGLAVYTIASKNLSAYASLTREGLLPALSVVAGSFVPVTGFSSAIPSRIAHAKNALSAPRAGAAATAPFCLMISPRRAARFVGVSVPRGVTKKRRSWPASPMATIWGA